MTPQQAFTLRDLIRRHVEMAQKKLAGDCEIGLVRRLQACERDALPCRRTIGARAVVLPCGWALKPCTNYKGTTHRELLPIITDRSSLRIGSAGESHVICPRSEVVALSLRGWSVCTCQSHLD